MRECVCYEDRNRRNQWRLMEKDEGSRRVLKRRAFYVQM